MFIGFAPARTTGATGGERLPCLIEVSCAGGRPACFWPKVCSLECASVAAIRLPPKQGVARQRCGESDHGDTNGEVQNAPGTRSGEP